MFRRGSNSLKAAGVKYMAIYTVSSTSEFSSIMKKVKAGDTVQLKSGTYDGLVISGLAYSKPITITSANSSSPAEVTGLTINKSSGINISNIMMTDKNASTLYDFSVLSSSNIGFNQVKISGEAGSAGYDSAPFLIRNSQNVSVTNSEVTHARYGISMLNNSGVTVSGNYFHDLRTDGVRGGGNSNINIAKNIFTDFHPADGDHPDAIQFWTTNTSGSASNITISDNVIMRGDGDAMQGVFMRDEVGNLPYKNVVISGNIVVGGMYHGITVGNAQGLTVTNNQVTGYADQKSWISVTSAATLTGNTAQTYIINGVAATTAPTGNTFTSAVYDDGSALLAVWLSKQSALTTFYSTSKYLAVPYADLVELASAPPPPVPVTTVYGTDGADRLKAVALGDSILIGGLGNDSFTGGTGNTRMEGGAGDDIFYVNSGRDIVIELAAGGNDTVSTTINYTLTENVETLRVAAAGLTVYGNDIDNRMVGSAGIDTMFGGLGNDSLQGLDGDDYLDGGAGDDSLAGGLGSDRLSGGDGNDKLYGNEGNDFLWGGAGDDLLEGGAGDDVMSGGTGKDLFQFRPGDLGGYDVITDLNQAEGDRISLSLIDANSGTTTNDAFAFIGTANFSSVAGELRYAVVDGGVLVQGDVDGDGIADLSILVSGWTSVSAQNFIL